MIDLANWSAWGIRPDYLEGLLNDPDTVVKLRTAVETDAALAAVRTNGSDAEKPYLIVDGVAVIPMVGPLSKRMSFLTWLMGGHTFGQLAEMIRAAVADPQVHAIVLDVDSPGGTVSGTDALAEQVAAAAAIKPVVAFANGCMCSAAYWVASAASLVITERTAAVGSIGVLMVHADFSKLDEQAGIKYTVIASGKYKAVGNRSQPLSDADRKILQAELDAIYTVFVSAVAVQRGVEQKIVQKEMAEGRIFIGQAAVDAGLADGVGNWDSAVAAARALANPQIRPILTGARPPDKEQQNMDSNNTPMITAPTTVAELAAAFPEMADALRNQGAEQVDTQAVADNASQRVIGLARIHFGAEAGDRFAGIVESGVTTEQYQAICGDTAPGMPETTPLAGKEEILAALKQSGPDNPGTDTTVAETGDFMTLVRQVRADKNCTLVQAMQAVARKHPELHAAYIEKHNPRSRTNG